MHSSLSMKTLLRATTVACSAALLLPSSAHAMLTHTHTHTYACQAQVTSAPSWPAINFTTRSDLDGDVLARILESNAYRGFRVTCNKVAG